ncbi:hypothetical protein V8C34DRAFT_267682 [Trichoderma compactum]
MRVSAPLFDNPSVGAAFGPLSNGVSLNTRARAECDNTRRGADRGVSHAGLETRPVHLPKA